MSPRRRMVEMVKLTSVFIASAVLVACTPYRIEYHKRPAFYKQASDQELPDEVVLDNGTVIKFVEQDVEHTSLAAAGSVDALAGEKIELRDQSPEGTVTLRAYAPEHVLAHAKRGIRQREYRVLWEQLLSERTRSAYEREGKGYEDFAQFCDDNRGAMMETFNRMGFGLYSPDVIQESIGPDAFRYRLHPNLGDQFVFTEFDLVREPGGLKWLMIR